MAQAVCVAAQPRTLAAISKCAHSILLAGDLPHRPKPRGRAASDCPKDIVPAADLRLDTISRHNSASPALGPPSRACRHTGADKPARPSQPPKRYWRQASSLEIVVPSPSMFGIVFRIPEHYRSGGWWKPSKYPTKITRQQGRQHFVKPITVSAESTPDASAKLSRNHRPLRKTQGKMGIAKGRSTFLAVPVQHMMPYTFFGQQSRGTQKGKQIIGTSGSSGLKHSIEPASPFRYRYVCPVGESTYGDRPFGTVQIPSSIRHTPCAAVVGEPASNGTRRVPET